MSDPYLSLFRVLAAKYLVSRASILSLRVQLAELIAEKEGIAIEAVHARFDADEKKMHAQLLLEIEKEDPGFAAMMDLRSAQDVADAEDEGGR